MAYAVYSWLHPKEKGCIAEAIGGVISENLMNKEVLEK